MIFLQEQEINSLIPMIKCVERKRYALEKSMTILTKMFTNHHYAVNYEKYIRIFHIIISSLRQLELNQIDECTFAQWEKNISEVDYQFNNIKINKKLLTVNQIKYVDNSNALFHALSEYEPKNDKIIRGYCFSMSMPRSNTR